MTNGPTVPEPTGSTKRELSDAAKGTIAVASLLVTAGMLMVFTCGGVPFLGSSNNSFSPPDPPDRASTSIRAALSLAPKMFDAHLKAPSQATYNREDAVSTRLNNREGAELWRVDGTVDAPNSLGAKLRLPWSITVAFKGGKVFLVYASLDGKTVHGDESNSR